MDAKEAAEWLDSEDYLNVHDSMAIWRRDRRAARMGAAALREVEQLRARVRELTGISPEARCTTHCYSYKGVRIDNDRLEDRVAELEAELDAMRADREAVTQSFKHALDAVPLYTHLRGSPGKMERAARGGWVRVEDIVRAFAELVGKGG